MREVKNCLTCFYGIDDGKDFPKIILVGKVKNQPPDLTAGEFNRGE